jgi:hypothetical protein
LVLEVCTVVGVSHYIGHSTALLEIQQGDAG